MVKYLCCGPTSCFRCGLWRFQGKNSRFFVNSKPFGGSFVETSDDDSSSDEDMSDEAYAGDDEAKFDGTPEVTGVLNGINGDCEIQGNSNHVADSSPIIADNNMEGFISPVMTKGDSVGQGGWGL
ncbi:hypothetical protein Hanom_Chr08g00740011 [Helianthus anomalus]